MSNNNGSVWDAFVYCWIALILAIHTTVYIRKSHLRFLETIPAVPSDSQLHRNKQWVSSSNRAHIVVQPGSKATAINVVVTDQCKQAALCQIRNLPLEEYICVCGDKKIRGKLLLSNQHKEMETFQSIFGDVSEIGSMTEKNIEKDT
mmetsp:Transcript_20189/g.28576  ORF Transcript_20189/g.28576 Transcript_20189/m.28576 type:complete len:147 (-) Transcript_20189:2-442(-)